MNCYKVEIWWRYVINGEQEKDFDIFSINAKDKEELKTKIEEMSSKNHRIFNYHIVSEIPILTKENLREITCPK